MMTPIEAARKLLPAPPRRGGAAMMKPQRMRLSRAKGFNLQLASHALNGLPAVNCARPSIFGNPWKVGSEPWMSRDTVIGLHHVWITGEATDEDVGPQAAALRKIVLAELPRLRGHNLACHCPLPMLYERDRERDRCHCAILLKLAARP